MFYRRLGMAALLWFFLVLPLPASMVSFMVIETGLPMEARRTEYSSLWEDGLMSVFFDAGHIVSNSLVMRLEKTPETEFPQEAQADYLEASGGGAEFFVLVFLEYTPQGGVMRPQNTLVKIFTTGVSSGTPRTLIYEQRFPGTGTGLRDEYVRAQDTARVIEAQLKDR